MRKVTMLEHLCARPGFARWFMSSIVSDGFKGRMLGFICRHSTYVRMGLIQAGFTIARNR